MWSKATEAIKLVAVAIVMLPAVIVIGSMILMVSLITGEYSKPNT